MTLCAVGQPAAETWGIEALRNRIWSERMHPLRAGCIGDSVGYGLFEALEPSLQAAFGTNGAVSANEYTGLSLWTGSDVVSGGASWTGGASRVDQATSDWFAGHYRVPAGGSVTWTNRGASDSSVRADRACISYIAGPGYGSFKICVSSNNTAWVDVANLDAGGPVLEGKCYAMDLPLNRYKIRVVGVAGNNVILNAGLWEKGSTGLRTTEMFNGGITVAQMTDIPEKVWKPVFNALELDFLFWEMKDCQDIGTNRFAELWPAFESLLVKGFPGTVIVLIGTTPQRDNTDLLIWQNEFVRSRAIAAGWVYFDGYTPFGGYTNAWEQGWLTDEVGVHPSKAGHAIRARALLNLIGIGPLNVSRADDLLSPKVRLQARGIPGVHFALEESTDLLTWKGVATNRFTSLSYTLTKSLGQDPPVVHFYRTMILPD